MFHATKPRLQLLVIFGLAVGMAAPHSMADYYRWTDADGVTHFSEHPPEDQDSDRVKQRRQAPSKESSATTTAVDSNSVKPKEKTPIASAEETPKPIKDPQACRQAQENIKKIQAGGRLKEMVNGEYRYMDSDTLQKRLRSARKTAAENC